jgi:D-arabinose 1-dehydrogenase-like Zn-dependent alcohol dehydrogenase
MMDFCVKNGIYPEVEVIKMDQIMPSLQKLKAKNDRLVRFVIDCSSITA